MRNIGGAARPDVATPLSPGLSSEKTAYVQIAATRAIPLPDVAHVACPASLQQTIGVIPDALPSARGAQRLRVCKHPHPPRIITYFTEHPSACSPLSAGDNRDAKLLAGQCAALNSGIFSSGRRRLVRVRCDHSPARPVTIKSALHAHWVSSRSWCDPSVGVHTVRC